MTFKLKFTLVDERAIALHSITDHSLLVLLLPALAPGATILGKVEREHLAYEAVCIGALRVVGADADEGVGVARLAGGAMAPEALARELGELVQFMFVFRDLLELQCTAVVPHLARDLFRVR